MYLWSFIITSVCRGEKKNCRKVVRYQWTELDYSSPGRNPSFNQVNRLLHQEKEKVNLKNISFLWIYTSKSTTVTWQKQKGWKGHAEFTLNSAFTCFTAIQERRGSRFKQDWKQTVPDGVLMSNRKKQHPEDNVDRSNVSNWFFHPDRHMKSPICPNWRFSKGEI